MTRPSEPVPDCPEAMTHYRIGLTPKGGAEYYECKYCGQGLPGGPIGPVAPNDPEQAR